MDVAQFDDRATQDLLQWAERCRSRASLEVGSDAKAALLQLAEEFEAITVEVEGLVCGFESVAK
jgi:hypothetical protein